MHAIFYSLLISTGVLICFLAYLTYKLNKNRTFLDLLLINAGYLSAAIAFLPNEFIANEFIKKTSFKYSYVMDLITLYFLVCFLYEIISKKYINKKYKYLTIISAVTFLLGTIDIFIIKSPLNYYDILSNAEFIFIIISLIIIIPSSLKKMTSKTQSSIIKWFFIFILAAISDGILDPIFQMGEESEFSLTINIIFIVYIMKALYRDIEKLKENTSPAQESSQTTIEEKFKSLEITDREKEVALLIGEGKSNQEIADELYISIHTVKIHVSNVYKKFNIKKRMELINILNDLKN